MVEPCIFRWHWGRCILQCVIKGCNLLAILSCLRNYKQLDVKYSPGPRNSTIFWKYHEADNRESHRDFSPSNTKVDSWSPQCFTHFQSAVSICSEQLATFSIKTGVLKVKTKTLHPYVKQGWKWDTRHTRQSDKKHVKTGTGNFSVPWAKFPLWLFIL